MCEEIARAKEALAAENTRLATELAALDARAQQLQSEAFQLTMSLNASNEVMRRRHQKTQSRLPPTYDPRVLFATPGAGPSNPPDANQLMTSGAGGLAQHREMPPPHVSMAPPRYVPIPEGHFSNPMENLIAASARLAALPWTVMTRQRWRPGGSESFSRRPWLSKRPILIAGTGFIQLLRLG